MAKQTPIDYLLKHESIVLSAYRENDKKPKRTWEDLVNQLPELPGVMSAATFRQYITVFATIIEELDKVRHEPKALDQKPAQSTGDPPSLKQASSRLPKRVGGWNLRRSKDGYLRCYRKIDAKLHSIYLGKTFDPDKTERLIVEKEKKIRLDMS
jgi:hypothetical protein